MTSNETRQGRDNTFEGFCIHQYGNVLGMLILGIALLGLGFILTHSTLLTRATEFAQKARGAAMSLVAFFFMGGGGISTAIGGRIIVAVGLSNLFLINGIALVITLLLSFVMIRDHVVEPHESKEMI